MTRTRIRTITPAAAATTITKCWHHIAIANACAAHRSPRRNRPCDGRSFTAGAMTHARVSTHCPLPVTPGGLCPCPMLAGHGKRQQLIAWHLPA
eukprot:358280-Chlamydomonas_euryale.AAC.1